MVALYSFLESLYGEFLAFFNKIKPLTTQINTTVIPFASKTTVLLSKEFSYCRLLFVSVEGNIKNSDKTIIKYKRHDQNIYRQKFIYGSSHVKFNDLIDEILVTPAYGDTRYGRLIVTYEGDYFEPSYVGAVDSPHNVLEHIESLNLGLNILRNNRFENKFLGWYRQDEDKITLEDDDQLGKKVKFDSAAGSLIQIVYGIGKNHKELNFRAYKLAVGGANIRTKINYTTGSASTKEHTLGTTWLRFSHAIDTTRTIASVEFTDMTGICYLGIPQIGDVITVYGDVSVTGVTDDSIKGLLRSIGDAGATPSNTTGYTLLKLLYEINQKLYGTASIGLFRSIGDAGATPTNVEGKTMLKYLSDIDAKLAGGGTTYKLASKFLIYKSNGTYYAMDRDGVLHYPDADCSNVLQDIIDNNAKWHAHFTDGIFTFLQKVDFATESYFGISGSLGWGTEIRLGANLGNNVNFWEFDYDALAQGRFTLRDLYFNMDSLTYSSQDCLSIDSGERWSLENIKIVRPHRDGLNIFEDGSYTRYNTIRGLQVYYAGRYGVLCNGRDNNFFDIQVEYPFDSCFVFGSAGAGSCIYRLHSTGAYNSGQIAYTSQIGGGNSRRCGLELLGSGNTVHGQYLDRCYGYGAYIAGANNALMGGRVYECNYNQADGQLADVYILGDYNRIVGLELNAQASHRTDYGVHLIAGADLNTVIANICRDHAIAKILNSGANNEVAHNTGA